MQILSLGKGPLAWGVSFVVSALGSQLAQLDPGSLDSALFGPLGGVLIYVALALAEGGNLLLGPLGAAPVGGVEGLAPVPSAAPLHVLGLLSAGALDLSGDQGAAASPLLGFLALLLGGL